MSIMQMMLAGSAGVSLSYVGATEDTSNATAYTFTSHSIGAAAANRVVHVGIVGGSLTTISSPSSVTIGGTAASLNVAVNTGVSNGFSAAIASLAVPTGTTATIVVNFSTTQVRCKIVVWASYGAFSALAFRTGTDTDSDPLTASLDVPAGGFVLAISKAYRASGYLGGTWTNVTEDYDGASGEGATTQGETAASKVFNTAQTGLSVQVDNDSATYTAGVYVLAAAVFVPESRGRLGVWQSGGNLNTARYGLAGAGTQNAGLSFGGTTGSASAATEEYNGTSWTNSGSLATARYYIAGCGYQDAGLSFGGYVASSSAVTEEYDGASWSSGGALATARHTLAGCGTQVAGLSFGGTTGTVSNKTEEYNGTSWSAGGNLITGRENIAGCGTQDAGLSFGGGTGSNACEEYDGSSWAGGGNLTIARGSIAGAGSQDAGLSIGGDAGGGVTATEEYNGTSWVTGGNLATARNYMGGAGIMSSGLCCGGSTGSASAVTEEYI